MTTATAAKERPILFSSEMVRAILSGRKTQTRRVVKHRDDRWEVDDDGNGGPLWPFWPDYVHGGELDDPRLPCPYGVPGDRLWVRETWGITAGESTRVFDAGQVLKGEYDLLRRDLKLDFHFRADGERREVLMHWRPSIHMPRSASRITLEITGVRVERVQEISEADAIAEGSQCAGVPASLTNRGAFAKLWDSINGKRGFGWDVNPWTWVIEFKRIDSEESE